MLVQQALFSVSGSAGGPLKTLFLSFLLSLASQLQDMEHRITFRVKEKIRETPRATTLVLDTGEKELSYLPGQFLTFLFPASGAPPVRRSYSLCTTPGVDPDPAITVQKVVNGSISRYLVETVRPGDTLTALAPAGRFTLPVDPEGGRDLFFFGGGSGITPLFSLIKSFLTEEPDSRVHLLYANRNERTIIFRKKLRDWAARFPGRFHCHHLLSDPEDLAAFRAADAPVLAQRGRLSNFLVEGFVTREMQGETRRAHFFLCGPRGLMLKTEQTLGFLGFDPEQVHKEIFTVTGAFRPPEAQFPDCRVSIHQDGRVHQFDLSGGETILEAARRTGLKLPYSCLSGICTTCAARGLSGKVVMYTQEGRLDSDLTHGTVLTCVGYPVTEEVALVFE